MLTNIGEAGGDADHRDGVLDRSVHPVTRSERDPGANFTGHRLQGVDESRGCAGNSLAADKMAIGNQAKDLPIFFVCALVKSTDTLDPGR